VLSASTLLQFELLHFSYDNYSNIILELQLLFLDFSPFILMQFSHQYLDKMPRSCGKIFFEAFIFVAPLTGKIKRRTRQGAPRLSRPNTGGSCPRAARPWVPTKVGAAAPDGQQWKTS
jgi:hypothetical protein